MNNKDRGSSSYYIIIGRIDRQEVRVDAEKSKELEIKLRKNIELYEHSRIAEEKPQVKLDNGGVIRRRKGEPDRRISSQEIKI